MYFFSYDGNKKGCGVDIEVINAPYIYLVAPFKDTLTRAICVEQCPDEKGSKIILFNNLFNKNVYLFQVEYLLQ